MPQASGIRILRVVAVLPRPPVAVTETAEQVASSVSSRVVNCPAVSARTVRLSGWALIVAFSTTRSRGKKLRPVTETPPMEA